MNNKVELYFPTKSKGDPIDHTAGWYDAFDNVRDIMINLFGGCTSQDAEGWWRNGSSRVCSERIIIVFSYCDNQQLNAYRGHMNNLARKICLDLKQDTVALVINGEMNFVS